MIRSQALFQAQWILCFTVVRITKVPNVSGWIKENEYKLVILMSCSSSPTPLRSTVSAQPRKRATCGEQEVGCSWFSLRQRSNSTNSLEQPCLILWITGLWLNSGVCYKYGLQNVSMKSRCQGKIESNAQVFCRLTGRMCTVQPSSLGHDTDVAKLRDWRPHRSHTPPFLCGNTLPWYPSQPAWKIKKLIESCKSVKWFH